MNRIMARRKVTCFRVDDSLVAKEDVFPRVKPLELRGGGIPLAVTMRTFNSGYGLAADFVGSQGLTAEGEQFAPTRYCAGSAVERLNTYSVLDDLLGTDVWQRNSRLELNSYATNSYDVCSQTTLTWGQRGLCMK